jgi:hypothetical protein
MIVEIVTMLETEVGSTPTDVAGAECAPRALAREAPRPLYPTHRARDVAAASTTQEETKMATKKSLALALGTMLVWGGTAAAADVLFSPPLVPEGQNTLDCYLVNVSNAPRQVKIEVFSRDGNVVKGGTITTTLGPGREDVARATADLLPRYCKFTVQGKRQNFRASVLVRDETVGAISALPAF